MTLEATDIERRLHEHVSGKSEALKHLVFRVLQVTWVQSLEGALKMREWKMQEWKLQEKTAGVEIAEVEEAGVDRTGGICRSGKSRSR